MLRFDEAVRRVIENYKDFDGRSRRSEFWWFQLALVAMTFIVASVDMALGYGLEDGGLTPATGLFILITIVPTAAVTARRLHDVGLTGWAQLPLFVTYIGYIPGFENFLLVYNTPQEILLALVFAVYAIWFLINCIKDSQPGRNKYGHNPKTGDVSGNFD